MKLEALIVDDEPGARSVLKSLLLKYCPNVNVLAECENLKQAVKAVHQFNPQLVFLDIKMPDYDGFEIVKLIEDINFEIIFITAFDQYAIKAFELSAIDYILKPVDRNRLVASIEKVESKLQDQDKLKNYEVLLDSLNKKRIEKIVIPELGNRRVVDLDEILAFEADGAYCKIHFTNDQTIILGKNLKHFESILQESDQFFRTHRTWLINLNFLTQVNKTELVAKLANKLNTKIARSRYQSFEEKIQVSKRK